MSNLFLFLNQQPPQIEEPGFFNPSPLAIVLAVILGLLLIALIIWLIISKELPKWAKAASLSRQWNTQDNKLTNELKNLARDLNQQHTILGKETWEARLSDPAYEAAYTKLVNVNQQVLGMKMHANTLKEELDKATEHRKQIETQYDEQLNKLDFEQRNAQTHFAELTKRHKTLDVESTELNMNKARVQREIKEIRTNIIEIENSDAPNKSALVFPLNSKLEQLSISLTDLTTKSPSIEDEIIKVESELGPLNVHLEELGKNFSRAQLLKAQELIPLDEHIGKLIQSLKKKDEEIAQLESAIPAMLQELGAHVDHARPASLRLAPLYANLDDIRDRSRLASEEQQQLRLLMDKGDKASARKFTLFWVLVVVALVSIACILLFMKSA